MTSPGEWMDYYQATMAEDIDAGGFTDAVITSTTSVGSDSTVCLAGQLSPTGSSSTSKPVRKRSRASRRTPTTMLNASPTNFRALVQQYTGCPAAPPFLSGGVQLHRGPINLSFGADQSRRNDDRHYNFYDQSDRRHQDQYYWQQQQQQQRPHEQRQQQQLIMSGSASAAGYMDVSERLVMQPEDGLHGNGRNITSSSYSGDRSDGNGGGYFF
ncbi:VQ motif-containing protein 22 [Malania oleifera]|uniref:VQ motif-containing protein 22 n=1 Tax=Malania oleifera TaxID=397392 RepID=UPI0025ADAD90|nr:VQ motif-containing protein 22 [Malania oleifera]